MNLFWKPPKDLSVQVLRLSFPIMLASLSQVLMSLIDIAMVGRLGAAAVAAVGLGGMVTYAVGSFLDGIQVGVQTVVARRMGAGHRQRVADVVRVGLVFSLAVGTVAAAAFTLSAGHIYQLINPDLEVVRLGAAYLEFRAWSIGVVMLSYVFYGFYNGISRPRVHLIVSLTANTLNVVLNYGLIFGRLGLPAMGAPGAGLATSLASLVSLALYGAFTLAPTIRENYPGLWRGALNGTTLTKLLRLSLPSALQDLGIMAGFTAFMMIMGWVDTVALAATEIVFNILSFSFMPALGFYYAAQTLVSENIGRKQLHRAVAATWTATYQSILLMGSLGLLFLFIPGPILSLFTTDSRVVQTGILPLRILGVVQIFDAVNMVYLGALRGAGDTLYPAITELLLMWLFFLPVTYVTSIHFSLGIVGGWLALGVYIAAYALLLFFRFRRGRWRRLTL